ncbi:MAG: iron ABC transporter permease, partial [Anaerolineaceae bacterium]|nr:iron ABC transporter permease [Anaerolineaceae bacterium]
MQKELIELQPKRWKWIIMILFPTSLVIVSLFLGRYVVPPAQVLQILGNKFLGMNFDPLWTSSAETVILQVRLPRAIMAALIGAGLSMSGASFQGMFQNPLVSPFILGVSAGASFGAAMGLVLELPALAVQGLAFVFGILAVGLAYFLAHIYKATPILMLVLSGMVVSAFFQSLLSLIKFVADDEEKLPAITFWLMGSLGSIEVKDLTIAVIPITLSMIVLYLLRWKLNVLSMGDRESRSLGVNNELMKG